MSTIPLPALDVKPAQSPDVMGDVSKLMMLRQMMNQNTSQQQEQQIRQQQIQDQQATTSAMKNWDGKDYDALSKSILENGGSANAAQNASLHGLNIKKQVSDIAAQDATTGSKNLETFIGTHKAVGDALEPLVDPKIVPDDQLHQKAADTVNQLRQGKVIGDAEAQQAMGVIQNTQDPTALRTAIDTIAKTSMGAKAIAEQHKAEAETTKDTAQGTEATAAAEQKRTESQWYQQHGGAPGVPVEAQQQADWLKKNPGKGPSDFAIAMKKIVPAYQFNLQSGLLNDQAKDMAAENYYQTGQLPAGARSPAIISSIINRAAELHPGGNLAGNKAAFEANKSSLTSLQKNFDQVTAFENTAGKNLDVFLGTAKKVIDSGSPWINRPLRVVDASGLGDADQAAFNAARVTAVTEIAKVLNSSNASGVLSDSARHEVEGLIGPNASLKQIVSAANILKRDMGNRHEAYQMQIGDIQKRMGPPSQTSDQKTDSTTTAATKTYQGHTYEQQPDGSWKLKQ